MIPCYNAEQWVGQAIESALEQTYSNKEVIVIDDGSTDQSLNVIKQFGKHIRWQTQTNQGGNITRNKLLDKSTGEWLQYLDSDDYLKQKKIEEQIIYLQQNPDTDIVYSPSIYEYIQSDGSAIQEILPIPQPHDPWILLARWFLPQTGSPLWRKQAIIDAGKWKINQPCCQEHELYLRLLKTKQKFVYFNQAGSVYRQWSENTVCKKDKPEVFRRRLAIETDLESYLNKNNQLTLERQTAINQARFECARQIWLFDPVWAQTIAQQIKATQKNFIPSGSAAPQIYRLIYQAFGFTAAESIGEFNRKFLKVK